MTDSEKIPQSEQYFGRTRNTPRRSLFEMADDDDDTDDDDDLDKKVVQKEKQSSKGGVFSTNKQKVLKTTKDRKEKQVWAALANLEADSKL
jgi:hypothetical protein